MGIEINLIVCCELCPTRAVLGSKTVAKGNREAKEKGWELTRKDGWICPTCAGKRLAKKRKYIGNIYRGKYTDSKI